MYSTGNAAVSGRCAPPDPAVRGPLQPSAAAQRHRLCDADGYAGRPASGDPRRAGPEVGVGPRATSTASAAGSMSRRGATMILPGETEAGSAGMQPCRGIAWRAHRDDDRKRGLHSPALLSTLIGSKDPDALKIPARRAEFTLTEDASSPVHAEPEHKQVRVITPEVIRSELIELFIDVSLEMLYRFGVRVDRCRGTSINSSINSDR